MNVIEVAIHPGSSGYRVDVLRSPAGEAAADVALDVPALLAQHGDIQRAVQLSSLRAGRVSPEEEQLRDLGHRLFRALLGAEEVAGRYRAAEAAGRHRGAERAEDLRIVLRIADPALARLPWEAMYDASIGGYVCLRHQLVRHVGVPAAAAPLTVTPPLRVLGIVSSPRGRAALNVEKEKEQLTSALSELNAEGLVELSWAQSATWTELHDMLLGGTWHVVHYIGHGGFDRARGEGVLALVDPDGGEDLKSASRMVDLLNQARPRPRLVVLNSCSGAAASTTDLFSGTAAALIRGRVTAVAAMQYEITDVAATAFSRGFYRAIAHGRGVDEALSSGRVAIRGLDESTLEWVSPVLYLRGDGARLFEVPADNPPAREKHAAPPAREEHVARDQGGIRWPIKVRLRKRVEYFQDRTEREDLAEALREGVTVALVGTGGVGKTQLAADFAHKVWEYREVDLLVWVNASSGPTIISAYADAARRVGAASTSTADEQAAEDFLSWLADSKGRKWLLVLDDVADTEYLDPLWPPQNERGRILITTRKHAVASTSIRRVTKREVAMYSVAEALQYLRSILSGYPGALAGSEDLVNDLDRHPLALAAAAAYIRYVLDLGGERFGTSTCAEYAARFRGQRELTKIMPTELVGYERSIAAVWSISIDAVDESDPSGVARRLMVLLSLLSPNGIPFEILDTPEVHHHLRSRSTAEIDDALLTLRGLSLIDFAGTEAKLINIHVLIQQAVLAAEPASDKEGGRESIDGATRALADSMSAHWPDKQHNTVRAGLLRANAAALCATNAAPLQAPGLHELLFQLGDGYGRAGLVEQANEYFTELRDKAISVLGPDSPDTLTVREDSAYWLGFTGKAEAALSEFRAIAASRARVHGRRHPATFKARHNSARFRGRSGDPRGAVDDLERLVSEEIAALGPDAKQTLESRNILGYWMGKAGDGVRAVAYLEKLLAYRCGLCGCTELGECGDPGVLTTRIDLAITKADLGRYAEAVTLAETVVRDRTRVAPEAPETLSAGAYLACWRALSGDESAIIDLVTSVSEHLCALGDRHPNTLRAQALQVEALKAAGRITAAEASARMTSHLAVIHEQLGRDHVVATYCQQRVDQWKREGATGRSEGES